MGLSLPLTLSGRPGPTLTARPCLACRRVLVRPHQQRQRFAKSETLPVPSSTKLVPHGGRGAGFGSCLGCFELVKRGSYLGRDFLLLETKFDNQRLRSTTWGKACG
jgi:hypothetical protein